MARILIIEDDEDLRGWMRIILEDAGHDIIEAENGLEATDLHKATPFNLIITDLFMPEKEGFETIKDLKQEDPNVLIIAISTGGRFKSEANLRIAGQLGADHTISKPIDREQLLKIVDTCLTA